MLVNTRKLIFSLIVLSGWNVAQAQEVWTLKQCIDTAQVITRLYKSIAITYLSVNNVKKKHKLTSFQKLLPIPITSTLWSYPRN
jgi:uncharacterized membrane protein